MAVMIVNSKDRDIDIYLIYIAQTDSIAHPNIKLHNKILFGNRQT